mmetsp:Transcript_26861/g.61815  ORF Transcript_26861/g.61815 Transcript_26861/m.61815 type:complete len:98 (-) Transcript_26861:1229-1522(-)
MTIRSTISLVLLCLASAGAEHTHTQVTSLEEGLHGLELMAKFKSWMEEHAKVYVSHTSFKQAMSTWLDNNCKYLHWVKELRQWCLLKNQRCHRRVIK